MSTKTKYIDMGGLTPIVNGIRVNATKPGQLGTELTATEALYLDGLTPGTATASKAVVLGSSKEIATLGAVTMGALVATTGVFTGAVTDIRNVVGDGASVGLTAAQSGALCVCDKTDGFLFTLPEATASTIGLWYEFVTTAARASGSYKIITGNAADFLIGDLYMVDTDTSNALSIATGNGSTHISINIDAATKGGLEGDQIRVTCISATQWLVEGTLQHTGNVASPFATS